MHPVGGTENRIGRVRHPFIADDERCEVCAKLSELDGIGVWTAEMLMLHSLQRPDVLSFGDLAVQRGLRMLYHHRKITRPLFEKYRRRYSPYGSVACIYLWAVSAGAVEGLKDYAPKEKNDGRKRKNKGDSRRNSRYDGVFWYGVKSTGIVCKLRAAQKSRC